MEADRGRPDGFDLMTQFAHIFPVLAICEVLGIPKVDHLRFRKWGGDLAAGLDAVVPTPKQRAATESLAEMSAYLQRLIRQRRRQPGDDLLSRLALLEQDGDQLTDRGGDVPPAGPGPASRVAHGAMGCDDAPPGSTSRQRAGRTFRATAPS